MKSREPFEISDDHITLSPLDEFENDITNLSDEEITEIIIGFLSNNELASLVIELAIKNRRFYNLCKNLSLVQDGFWTKWSEYGAYNLMLQDKLDTFPTNFHYLPQANFKPINLIIGMHFYHVYHSTKDFHYLEQSAQYYCYMALEHICSLNLIKIKQELNNKHLYMIFDASSNLSNTQKEVFDLIEKTISLAKNAAQFHWAPGYILLSKVYLQIANTLNEHRKLTRQKASYLHEALKSIYIAERLAEASVASINNAFLGKGLLLENGIKTWFAAKTYIYNFAKDQIGIEIMLSDLDSIQKSAKDEADKILQTINQALIEDLPEKPSITMTPF